MEEGCQGTKCTTMQDGDTRWGGSHHVRKHTSDAMKQNPMQRRGAKKNKRS